MYIYIAHVCVYIYIYIHMCRVWDRVVESDRIARNPSVLCTRRPSSRDCILLRLAGIGFCDAPLQTRRRIHRARAAGTRPLPRDLLRLEAHHAVPDYKESALHMGKRGGQSWDGQEWDGYRSYSGWEESAAAMRPAKSKGKGKDQQRKKDEAAFPSTRR